MCRIGIYDRDICGSICEGGNSDVEWIKRTIERTIGADFNDRCHSTCAIKGVGLLVRQLCLDQCLQSKRWSLGEIYLTLIASMAPPSQSHASMHQCINIENITNRTNITNITNKISTFQDIIIRIYQCHIDVINSITS